MGVVGGRWGSVGVKWGRWKSMGVGRVGGVGGVVFGPTYLDVVKIKELGEGAGYPPVVNLCRVEAGKCDMQVRIRNV